MKRTILFAFLFFLSLKAFSQWPSVTIGSEDCAKAYYGHIYDNGGPFGDYSIGTYYHSILHASRPDYCIELYIDTVDIDDVQGDHIRLADGWTPFNHITDQNIVDSRGDSLNVGLFSYSGGIGGTGFSAHWFSVPQAYYMAATQSVTRKSGILYDLGGPSSYYPLGQSGQFTINAPNAGEMVAANFSYFQLATDSFFIYDGISSSAPLLWQGGFSNSPGYVLARSGHMTVRFHPNSQGLSAPGWRMIWNCVSPSDPRQTNTTIVSDNGMLVDDGGVSGNYSDNDSFVTTIMPVTAGDLLDLRIFKFSTERNFDYLSVYAGTSVNAPLIARFTGDSLIKSNYLSYSAITLKFTSDGSGSSDGFIIGWVAHAPPSECASSATGISEFSQESLVLYPNPTSNTLTIQNAPLYTALTVTNLLGEKILDGTTDGLGNLFLDISQLPAGMYMIGNAKFVKE